MIAFKSLLLGFLKLRTRSTDPDVELGPIEAELRPSIPFINGFPSAAAFIASDPDNSFSIYKSFKRLSARNILYFEAELLELQKQQDLMDAEDARGNPDTLHCFRSWKKLTTSSDPRQWERIELIQKIRATLKEYRKSPYDTDHSLPGMQTNARHGRLRKKTEVM